MSKIKYRKKGKASPKKQVKEDGLSEICGGLKQEI